jgi:hypothetical protein
MAVCWLSTILAPQDIINMEFKETVWVGFGCLRTGSSNEPSSSVSDKEPLAVSVYEVIVCLGYVDLQ